MARPEGFEPPAFWFEVGFCENQGLQYCFNLYHYLFCFSFLYIFLIFVLQPEIT